MVEEVTEQMEAYDLQKAIDPIVRFIDSLNNWYIRRSRRRFWKSENDLDKNQAYQALHTALLRLITVASPFIPFITEELYQNLKPEGTPESIHLCDWPKSDTARRDLSLEKRMEITRQAVSMGRSLRTMHTLKTRQPLKAIHLVTKNQEEKKALIEMEDIIKDELNIKEVVYRENEEELVEYKAKANYKVLGKTLGKDMKAAAQKIEALSMKEIQSILEGAVLSLDLGSRVFDLTLEGIMVIRNEKENLKVLNEGSLTVALDPELTDELIQEGMIRDIVRSIQNQRKEQNLEVTDRIIIWISGSDLIKSAVENFWDHLSTETLAESWEWEDKQDAQEVDCGNEQCRVLCKKA
jgi:isoleucyl-tRNA synthetase